MHLLQRQRIHQLACQPGIEAQLILLARVAAPLAQAAAQRIRADDAIALRHEKLRQRIHVTARAGQAVPGDHRGHGSPVGCQSM